MKSVPPSATPADAGHVIYEVKWFRIGMRLLQTIDDLEQLNLISEAVLLHMRNLLEFFYAHAGARSDTVRAGNFVDWRPSLDPGLDNFAGDLTVRKYHKRLSQHLAHISTHRDPHSLALSYDMEAAAVTLERDVRAFLAALPPEKAQWFSELSSTPNFFEVGQPGALPPTTQV